MKTFEFSNRKNIILLIVTPLCCVITIRKTSIVEFQFAFVVFYNMSKSNTTIKYM
jgi:hypothetical protein